MNAALAWLDAGVYTLDFLLILAFAWMVCHHPHVAYTAPGRERPAGWVRKRVLAFLGVLWEVARS